MLTLSKAAAGTVLAAALVFPAFRLAETPPRGARAGVADVPRMASLDPAPLGSLGAAPAPALAPAAVSVAPVAPPPSGIAPSPVAAAAPPDLTRGLSRVAEMPETLRRELSELGLL